MPVVGVGGTFFRARDPDELSVGHRGHLGIGAGVCRRGAGPPDDWSWKVQGGPPVIALFAAGTDWAAPPVSEPSVEVAQRRLDAAIERWVGLP